MEFDVVTLGVVIGMMVLANRLVASLITPLFEKYSWDKFWLMYPAWILSGVFVWFTGINLFSTFIPNELIGKILTAVVAGGGSNLLHDLTDKPDNLIAYFNGIESAILNGDGSGKPVGILQADDLVEKDGGAEG